MEPIDAHHNALLRGTVQHQVLEGADAVAFSQGDVLSINIDCRVDTGRLRAPVRYALAVSLEVGTSIQTDLFVQVRQGLQQLIQERQRQQIAAR